MLFTKDVENLVPEVKYVTGVGTCYMDEITMTKATGTDIPDRMKRGYDILSDWLNDNKCKPEENRIYLFGFSRGAYTARLFAHLIDKCGIPHDKRKCDEVIDAFLDHDTDAGKLLSNNQARRMPITALCVWDTVKAAWIDDYDDEALPDIVENAFHAMSIDENRGKFKLTQFNSDRAVQRWFPGVHSDVGGGYLEDESDLSNIALIWMLGRARDCGMKFDGKKVCALSTMADGKMHDEMNAFWASPIGGGIGYRDIDDGSPIDDSAYKRKELKPDYRPANRGDLPELPV